MNKEKALKNQGLEFREDISIGGGVLPELILSAITGTDVITAIIAPSIIPGIHFLNLIAHIPPVIFR